MDVTARHNGMNNGDRGPVPQAARDADARYDQRVISVTACPECRARSGQSCHAPGMTSIAPWVHPARIVQFDRQEVRS